jgi:hypothetical protein
MIMLEILTIVADLRRLLWVQQSLFGNEAMMKADLRVQMEFPSRCVPPACPKFDLVGGIDVACNPRETARLTEQLWINAIAIPATQAEFCVEIHRQWHRGLSAYISPPIQQVAELRDDASSSIVFVSSPLGYLAKCAIPLPGRSAPGLFSMRFDENL